MAIVVAFAVLADYHQLNRLMYLVMQKVDSRIPSTPAVEELLREADARAYIYRPQAEHLLGVAMPLTKDDLAAKIASTDKLLRYGPTPISISKRATLAVLDGELTTARDQIARL